MQIGVNLMNLTVVTLSVPTTRVSELYKLLAQWTESEEAAGEDVRTEVEATVTNGTSAPRRRRGRISRYEGLREYLGTQKDSKVKLTFDEIEEAIAGELPASAHRHRPWWSNSERHAQAKSWLTTGWRVNTVDLEGQTVEFARS